MGPLRVAIGGLGTVGAAVADILISRKDLIAARCGRQIDLVAVSAAIAAAIAVSTCPALNGSTMRLRWRLPRMRTSFSN